MIRILNEHTINQIAAGEVIENSASVVKELVENALDAKASSITVEIAGGGRQLIRITDNGIGMSSDDALLSLERHATSKIRSLEDITQVGTLGFRGEAIPSIASISKFSILTSQDEKEMGTLIRVDGGKVLETAPVPCAKGTTVEVKSLFFNVPVRKKFQRSPTYDANEIQKVIQMQAIAHPQVQFKLVHNGQTLFHTHPQKESSFLQMLKEKVGDVLGKEVTEELCPLNFELSPYRIQGFVALPHLTRPNKTGQLLFINQRAVRNGLISQGVTEGFGSALSTNRHPIFVLHITMPGQLVDVNVHPQKREVRLREEYQLKEALVQAVQKALQRTQKPSFTSLGISVKPLPLIASAPEEEKTSVSLLEREEKEEIAETLPLFTTETFKKTITVLYTTSRYILTDTPLTKEEPGLCLIDQHAAHSRVLYEKMLSQKEGVKLPQQQLLIPYTFQTTPLETERIKELLEPLNSLGISIQEFGPHTFMIDALPEVFGKTDPKSFMAELQSSKQELKSQVAYAATRAALAKETQLSLQEGQLLINQLVQCEHPLFCPLGKPTEVHLSPSTIQKLFQGAI